MKNLAPMTWIIGALLSAGLSWRALNPQPPYAPSQPHQALPRPATQAEQDVLEVQADQLSAWIEQARVQTGAAIPASQVEAHLPQIIFDNPLVDGVGGIQESCPVDALERPGLDWVYCPDTGRFRPNFP
jgi:hypothetical protein